MTVPTYLEGVDLTCGLDPGREQALAGPPPDLYRYSENWMLAAYDPDLDLGMWLHLGACPDDFGLWEEIVLIALPGDDGLLWARAYCRPPDAAKPCGPNLRFQVDEPFVTMDVHFDAVGVRTPYDEMLTDRVRDGRQELLSFDLRVESLAPAWDNHQSAAAAGGRGSMLVQNWAREHYQQALQATGTMHIGGEELNFRGTGTRDHSRGQRGHRLKEAGGHNLWVAPFASGKAFGMQRMWKPDGTPSLDVGFVFIDGELHHCDLVSPPAYLREVNLAGTELSLTMRSPVGEHTVTGTLVKTLYCTYRDNGWNFAYGADPGAGRRLFVPGFCRWEWDGETAYGLAERSGPLGEPGAYLTMPAAS